MAPDHKDSFCERPPPAGDREIYVVDLDLIEFDVDLPSTHEALENLSQFPGAFEDNPAWHPDGDSVLFSSLRNGGQYDIYEVNLTDNSLNQLTTNANSDYTQRTL